MSLPVVIETDDLAARLGEPELIIVDLGRPSTYRAMHIPGALHLDYPSLILVMPPAPGIPAPAAQLARVFSNLGIRETSTVVAYDDEGGASASRLLWTLDATTRFRRCTVLNGGLHAWAHERYPLTDVVPAPQPANITPRAPGYPLADVNDVLNAIDATDTVLLDVRSSAEYFGAAPSRSRRGHIPGALNLEWTRMIDPANNMRLHENQAMLELLGAHGVTQDKEVIVYCQTHHRSAHTYMALKQCGFERVRAYAGAWSEWAEREDLPIETQAPPPPYPQTPA